MSNDDITINIGDITTVATLRMLSETADARMAEVAAREIERKAALRERSIKSITANILSSFMFNAKSAANLGQFQTLVFSTYDQQSMLGDYYEETQKEGERRAVDHLLKLGFHIFNGPKDQQYNCWDVIAAWDARPSIAE